MSELYGAVSLYGTDLSVIQREIGSIYWNWSKDLMLGKPVADYFDELLRLQFSAQAMICEDIIKRSSKLVQDLNRLFFVDTSQLNVAIDEAKRQKIIAERCFKEERKHEEGIRLMRNAVDKLFKVYSSWKAKKFNLERNSLKKWGGVIGGIYILAMTVYFYILNFMQFKPDYTLGFVVPASTAILLILLLLAIFSPREETF